MRLMIALTLLLFLGANLGWADDDSPGSESPATPPGAAAPSLPDAPPPVVPPSPVPQAATPAPASPPDAGRATPDRFNVVSDSIVACAAMLDNFERLTCYDILAADLKSGKLDSPQPEPDKGGGTDPHCFMFNSERVCE